MPVCRVRDLVAEIASESWSCHSAVGEKWVSWWHVLMTSRAFWQSRTFWTNIFTDGQMLQSCFFLGGRLFVSKVTDRICFSMLPSWQTPLHNGVFAFSRSISQRLQGFWRKFFVEGGGGTSSDTLVATSHRSLQVDMVERRVRFFVTCIFSRLDLVFASRLRLFVRRLDRSHRQAGTYTLEETTAIDAAVAGLRGSTPLIVKRQGCFGQTRWQELLDTSWPCRDQIKLWCVKLLQASICNGKTFVKLFDIASCT